MTIGVVRCEEHEQELEIVQALACGASEGVFGPASLMWRVDREAAIFLGAGRALLLQLAHPWVAAAIAEHSRTLGDPIGRFHRTFATVFSMVFGSLDQALASSRRLHRRHAAIEGYLPTAVGPFAAGSRYRANDIAALRWVHATLADTAHLSGVAGTAALCRPLSGGQGSVVGKDTTGPCDTGAQPILDRAAPAGMTKSGAVS
jgi:uncharacterized protein (DUF2236 family)